MKYRTLFISDVHLGRRFSKLEKLLSVLSEHDFEYIILVGDIIDIWSLKRKVYWRTAENTVIQKLLRAARKGTKIIYIPGNHDEDLRQFDGEKFGNIHIHNEYKFKLKDDRVLLILHGDKFDGCLRDMTFLYHIGDFGYQLALWLNFLLDPILKQFNKNWSASKAVKYSVKNVVKYCNNYKRLIEINARDEDVHGVCCGHIHQPELIDRDEFLYINCGCWIEHCTYVVEHKDGKLELLRVE